MYKNIYNLYKKLYIFVVLKLYKTFYMNKDTKSIPKKGKREQDVEKRFDLYTKSISVLRSFYDLGFNSFPAFKGIVFYYYPSVDEKKLQLLWLLRNVDDSIYEIITDVLNKLKVKK